MVNINNSILHYTIVLFILLGLGYSDPNAQGKASSINPKHQAYGKTNYDHTQTINLPFYLVLFLVLLFLSSITGTGILRTPKLGFVGLRQFCRDAYSSEG